MRCSCEKHFLRRVAVAGAGEVLDLVHHVFQIALAQHVLRLLVHVGLRRVLHALRKLVHELLHRFPQFLHQLGDLLVGGIALQRFRKRGLRIAQAFFCLRKIAILNAECDFPEVISRILQHLLIIGEPHAGLRRLQQEIMRGVGNGLFRAQAYRLVIGDGLRHLARVQ